MKDLPIFTGEFGVATLILREIPYRRQAYVIVRDVRPGYAPSFYEECCGFCRAAGAERSLLSSDPPPEGLHHVHDMLELSCRRDRLPPAEPVTLAPLTDETAETFRSCYNRLFRDVLNAATCTREELERVRREEQACLALVDGQVAGIGQWTDGELRAVGVLPAFRGLGRRLTTAILGRMTAKTVTLRVSSVNAPALALYRGLGFGGDRVVSRWYALDGFRAE